MFSANPGEGAQVFHLGDIGVADEGSKDVGDPDTSADSEIARLVNDARTLWEQRALADSEAPLRRALELAERSLGADHPLLAVVLSHLSWLAAAREQHDEAVSSYRRALAIREAQLGPSHSDTLHALEELAAALSQADARAEEADALALRAISAYETTGRDDPEFAGLVATVAWRRFWIGRYAEAEPMFLRALDMQERLLGRSDLATAGTSRQLAIMYDHRGFDVDPEPYYRQALAGYELAHSDHHPDVLDARYRLADYLRRHGRDDDARPLFERLAATLRAGALSIDLDKVHWILGGCCDYLRNAGREAEAKAIEERASQYDPYVQSCKAAAEQTEAAFGSDALELAEALSNLSGAYAVVGQVDEAEAAGSRAVEILRARLGPDHPSTVEMATRRVNIRDFSASFAEHRPALRRLGLDHAGDKSFNSMTFPWRDERRSELIRAYLAALADNDEDDSTGAVGAITGLTFIADLEEQWEIILELIAEAPNDDWVLQSIAAGPLEGFLGRFDAAAIDHVEAEAAKNPGFRRVLSGVWKHRMTDPVWSRVRAIQATVNDPLPEMRPFTGDAGETERSERDDR
jgi:tetratricopeptide (TPR) repeat protein